MTKHRERWKAMTAAIAAIRGQLGEAAPTIGAIAVIEEWLGEVAS